MYVKRDINGRKQKKKLRRYKLSYVLITLPVQSPSALELVPIEADKTRWWLQEQNCWLSSQAIQVPSLEDDNSMLYLYPIVDDPIQPIGLQKASIFLAFNATVYIKTEIGLVPFDLDNPKMEEAAEYVVDKLRLTRGE